MAPMTRSDFAKCCAAGLCSCLAMAALPTPSVAAATNPEADWLKEQLQAIRVRYAKLVAILDRELDEPQKARVFDGLGRACAQEFRRQTIDRYQGDLDGFLKSIQEPGGWVATVEREPGLIRIVDRATRCTCPMVDGARTPALQCTCTLAWQKETYSAILGRPVEAELEESILRGGKRCVFRIMTS